MAAPARVDRHGVEGSRVRAGGRLRGVDTVIVHYRDLPHDAGDRPRPLLDLTVGDVEDVRVRCLVDSGAQNTLFPRWVADLAAVDLVGAPVRNLAVAAAPVTAAFVPIRLTVDDHTWEAEVGFCDPWPYGWGLLGQISFFRYFTVTFRAADQQFEVEPVKR